MLVNHTNAVSDRIRGFGNGYFLTVYPDLTCIGSIDAIKNVHKGGFSGAVFAQECMDLSLFEGKIDVVVGKNTGEILCNPNHFKVVGHGQF